MKKFAICEFFKISALFLLILSIAIVFNLAQDISINSFAQKSSFNDQFRGFEDPDMQGEVIDDDADDGEGLDSSKSTGKDLGALNDGIRGFNDDDSGDVVSEEPDVGPGIPFECRGGTCTCDGSADCLDMGRADVCSGKADCPPDSTKCTCTMKQ